MSNGRNQNRTAKRKSSRFRSVKPFAWYILTAGIIALQGFGIFNFDTQHFLIALAATTTPTGIAFFLNGISKIK
jgi:hypothetical protein